MLKIFNIKTNNVFWKSKKLYFNYAFKNADILLYF